MQEKNRKEKDLFIVKLFNEIIPDGQSATAASSVLPNGDHVGRAYLRYTQRPVVAGDGTPSPSCLLITMLQYHNMVLAIM